VTEGNNSS
jgi:outer membrane protein assembly factor BamB